MYVRTYAMLLTHYISFWRYVLKVVAGFFVEFFWRLPVRKLVKLLTRLSAAAAAPTLLSPYYSAAKKQQTEGTRG